MCMWDPGIWMALGMSCKIPADTGLNLALDTGNCCVETFEGKRWWFQRNSHYRWDVTTLCNTVTNASVATSLHGALELYKGLFPTNYVWMWQRLSAWACTCPWQGYLGGTAVTGIEIMTGLKSPVPQQWLQAARWATLASADKTVPGLWCIRTTICYSWNLPNLLILLHILKSYNPFSVSSLPLIWTDSWMDHLSGPR